ncbi:MAG: hypothetical protein A2445_00305 [Candidatus Jacksonbacteria bacterium RIFOXYC2_FULL_44_29]|nr:MAG: hypothetical protein UW45_C0057G0002 [Parcubacteria group bacterium GW2011_GWC2_44_22]OGY75790.1 MAG: hypothetical protein A2240_00010 [Candidatus Jacksonbacteria bacterium RIFOXYA2_FULL_43_12]OGY76408.1 MAG: hypothetical protein A2295_06190 [Candidatus Jacksonbacteria bacterium RIFOXYB2_FULL_44_15]OGY78020.1 MAG: hypothetical protein A2550_01830 [Candidatus Jacksonbacteria bacterium RIFOXYD2_FULL_43_21]OGY79698.1 MAG: hypothetical protein A2445_00305 [Candidatus Jacksonbacteria bacteri
MECFELICIRHSLFVILNSILSKSKQNTMEKLNKVIAVKFYETRWFWGGSIIIAVILPIIVLTIAYNFATAWTIFWFTISMLPQLLLQLFITDYSHITLIICAILFNFATLAVITKLILTAQKRIYISTSIITIALILVAYYFSFTLLTGVTD